MALQMKPLLTVLLLTAASTIATPTPWHCVSDTGCQLNGVCVNGACQCDPQWTGSNCSRLNTGASRAAYTGMTENQSTWGGHPVWDEVSELWHGYFAEMTQHCDLRAWTTNSVIVHATSPTLLV